MGLLGAQWGVLHSMSDVPDPSVHCHGITPIPPTEPEVAVAAAAAATAAAAVIATFGERIWIPGPEAHWATTGPYPDAPLVGSVQWVLLESGTAQQQTRGGAFAGQVVQYTEKDLPELLEPDFLDANPSVGRALAASKSGYMNHFACDPLTQCAAIRAIQGRTVEEHTYDELGYLTARWLTGSGCFTTPPGRLQSLLAHAAESAASHVASLDTRAVEPAPSALEAVRRLTSIPLQEAGRPPAEVVRQLAAAGGPAMHASTVHVLL